MFFFKFYFEMPLVLKLLSRIQFTIAFDDKNFMHTWLNLTFNDKFSLNYNLYSNVKPFVVGCCHCTKSQLMFADERRMVRHDCVQTSDGCNDIVVVLLKTKISLYRLCFIFFLYSQYWKWTVWEIVILF